MRDDDDDDDDDDDASIESNVSSAAVESHCSAVQWSVVQCSVT